jgi:hypothetical protein
VPTVTTTMDLARAERADLFALLETLTPAQWEHPSLCDDWTVREVPAERLIPSLKTVLFAPPLRGILRDRDVRLVATDPPSTPVT